jgi:SAM-dependent methyltransferase
MPEQRTAFSEAVEHAHEASSYYADADTAGWLAPFWAEGSPFLQQIAELRLDRAVELACGHGRHTEQLLPRIGHITLVDVLASNITACRTRFGDDPRVSYLVNNGNDLPGIADDSITGLFSYDAMVHFELLDVLSYLRETRRVLVPGGRALLHVSNNPENPEGHFHANRHWRNFGGLDVVRHFAVRCGLAVLSAQVMDWSGVPALDGLLLLEKPA